MERRPRVPGPHQLDFLAALTVCCMCQAVAQFVVSAASGSERTGYNDFLKFLLPEADVIVLPRAVRLQPFQFFLRQATYDLEEPKSLADYLEESNIRLVRAECPRGSHSFKSTEVILDDTYFVDL